MGHSKKPSYANKDKKSDLFTRKVLTSPKANMQGPLISHQSPRNKSLHKKPMQLNEHLSQLSKKKSSSPSNAANDNYF